jgi:ABC-type antimicrobial peptide transport system permease subunit
MIKEEKRGVTIVTKVTLEELLKLKEKLNKVINSDSYYFMIKNKDNINQILLTAYGYTSKEYETFLELIKLDEFNKELKSAFERFLKNVSDVNDLNKIQCEHIDDYIIKEIKSMNIDYIKELLSKLSSYLSKNDLIFNLLDVNEGEVKYIDKNVVYIGVKKKSTSPFMDILETKYNYDYFVIRLKKDNDIIEYTKFSYDSFQYSIIKSSIYDLKKFKTMPIELEDIPNEVLNKFFDAELLI